MTAQTLQLLAVMLDDPTEEWYGLQLCRETGMKPGTTYPILLRLLRADWLERRQEDIDPHTKGRPARALYRFTPQGKLLAEEAFDKHLAGLGAKRDVHGIRRPGVAPA